MHHLGDRGFRVPAGYRDPVRWVQERGVCSRGEQPYLAPLAHG